MESEKLFSLAEEQRNKEKLDQALLGYEKTEEVALEEGNEALRAAAFHMSGVVYTQQGKYVEARTNLNLALSLFENMDNKEMVGAVLRDLGLLAYKQEIYYLAQRRLEESVGVLSQTSNKGHLGISQVKLGKVLAAIGKLPEAEVEIQKGLVGIEDSPDKFFSHVAYYDLAQVLQQKGDLKGAREAADKSLQILDQFPSEQHQTRREEIMKFKVELGTRT